MPHEITPGRNRRGQTTVYIQAREREWLARLGLPLAAQLREDLAVLQALGRAPELTEAEVNCLRDILNSTIMEASRVRQWPRLLALDVRDSAPDGLAQKWGVDLADLAARLEALHPADAWALVNEVRRWWAAQK